jgi:hypothetical protein
MPTHRMTIEDDDGLDVTFACQESRCGRRVVVRRSGGMLVLNRGDFSALHSGGSQGLHVGADLRGSA